MRILYVTNYQGPGITARRGIRRNRALGASNKVESIARALSRRGHAVSVLSLGTPAERSGRIFGADYESIDDTRSGIPVTYAPALDLPILNRWSGRIASSLWLQLQRGWDVALVYNVAREQLALAGLLRAAGVPVAFEYEDDACATLAGGPGTNPGGASLLSEARKIARGLIAVNEELRKQFSEANSIVVRGAVPDRVFDAPSRALEAGNPLRVLYAGGLTHAKGAMLAVQALEFVRTSVEITVVGSGPLAAELEAASRRDPRVRFMGEVSRAQLDQLFASTHVCVNPHRVDRGQASTLFPFKIAEYVASGACVVSSRLGEMPESLREALVTYEGDEPAALASAIDRVSAEWDDWSAKSNRARIALRDEVSETALGHRVEQVLERTVAAP